MRGAAFAFIPLLFLGIGLIIQKASQKAREHLALTFVLLVLIAAIGGLTIAYRQDVEFNRTHSDCPDVRGAKVGSLACNYVEEAKALEKSKE